MCTSNCGHKIINGQKFCALVMSQKFHPIMNNKMAMFHISRTMKRESSPCMSSLFKSFNKEAK